jgi:type VI secretion system protein ImpM
MPGVLPGSGAASAWAGVLMPSVDRVGRYFPLTVALPLPEGVGSVQQMTGLWYWLARLDELARDALYEDWTLEQLEDELSRMALPDVAASAPALPARPEAEGAMLAQEPQTDATQAIGAEAHQGWAVQARGLAWWQAKPDDGPARLWLSRGLPASAVLANLFGPAATI